MKDNKEFMSAVSFKKKKKKKEWKDHQIKKKKREHEQILHGYQKRKISNYNTATNTENPL